MGRKKTTLKRMKYLLVPFIVLCCFLTACSGKAPDGTAFSETAMENFLNKIADGNYVMDAPDYLKTTAYSKDLVYFDYTDENYKDLAVMSVNNETFQALLNGDSLGELRFFSEGQAIDAVKSRLLTYWLDDSVSQGNIYNLFYNDQENPLQFVSYEDFVKDSVRSMAGYQETAVRLMHEVYLVMDKEDPTEVHIKAEVDDDIVARINYEDIDIKITFGNAENNAAADSWMKSPVYPEAKTAWSDDDIFIFNSVFLQGYGEDVIPFPSFASYAMTNDGEHFVENDEVTIRDSHASEQDIADYIATLKAEGFTEVKEADEEGVEQTYYRRMLREEYKCYTSVHLEYDNGMTLKAKKYYDFPRYEDLASINEVIKRYGFIELPASENISAFHATDKANELTESWLYFFNYDALLYVDVDYENEDEVLAYLEDYANTLLQKNYSPVDEDDEEGPDYYASENGFASFRYHFDQDGKLTLLYKVEKYINAAEAEKMVQAAGFPAIKFTDSPTFSCRDLKKFAKAQYDKDANTYLSISQNFASTEEAEAFLSKYEEALNADGFDRENPEIAGTTKQIAIYNEQTGAVVGVDLFEQESGAVVNMEFQN